MARGGMVGLVKPRFHEVRVVAMPSISKARATNPTDWEQIGQDGTRSAPCAPVSLTAETSEGINSSSKRFRKGW